MSDKKLLPADLDPRNPSYAYKNKYNEHVENTDQFNNYVKSTEVKKVFRNVMGRRTGLYSSFRYISLERYTK